MPPTQPKKPSARIMEIIQYEQKINNEDGPTPDFPSPSYWEHAICQFLDEQAEQKEQK